MKTKKINPIELIALGFATVCLGIPILMGVFVFLLGLIINPSVFPTFLLLFLCTLLGILSLCALWVLVVRGTEPIYRKPFLRFAVLLLGPIMILLIGKMFFGVMPFIVQLIRENRMQSLSFEVPNAFSYLICITLGAKYWLALSAPCDK